MRMQSIPHTNLSVSSICLGTMMFGNPVPEDEAVRIVHWALDHGVNFLDTADMYEGYDRFIGSAGGTSERFLGKALRGRRDQAVITTKVGMVIGSGPYEGSGLNRKHILHQIDASLARLQTDRVDLYLLHKPDPHTPVAESIAVMAELVKAGKIRHWGFSNHDAAQIEEMIGLCDAHGWPRPVASQPHYNWLKRDIEAADLPACRKFKIAVTPYQPLAAGLLTGKYRRGATPPIGTRAAESQWLKLPDDATFDRVEQFEAEARAAGRKPTHHALRWLLVQPGVTSVIVGVKSIEQLAEATAA